MLLSNVAINDPNDAYEIVQWYLCRWQIEIYFRILKSGCNIEKLQLETGKRFNVCLTLYMIIAWRILYLTMLAREYPNAPCGSVFIEEEWKTAYIMAYCKKPPDQPITMATMLNLIAQMGGYLNRKHDGKPGLTSIWIGLQRLRTAIKAKNIFEAIRKETYG